MHKSQPTEDPNETLRRALRDAGIPLAMGTDPKILEATAKHIASEVPAVAEALRKLALGGTEPRRAVGVPRPWHEKDFA